MPAYKDEKKGTWYAQFYYTDWQGKKHKTKKRGFATKRDALAYEREFISKQSKSTDMTFESLVEIYFTDMTSRLRETTIAGKRNIFDTKLLPIFGKMKVNEINSSHVREWQAQMMKEGYAQTYLRTFQNQLSAVFNYACRYLPRKESCGTSRLYGQKENGRCGLLDGTGVQTVHSRGR